MCMHMVYDCLCVCFCTRLGQTLVRRSAVHQANYDTELLQSNRYIREGAEEDMFLCVTFLFANFKVSRLTSLL